MLLPPVSLLAVWTYYQKGQVDLKIALITAICFLPAAELGASLALSLPPRLLSQIFGTFAILVGLRLLWQKGETEPGDSAR
jgi:uncharacterized membrane protein YfcA